MNRREFLFSTTALTASAYLSDPLAAAGERGPDVSATLQSTLTPCRSGSLVDIARNRAAYQSSAADDDHTAHLVTDGSEQTYWESAPGGEQWVSVDLGEPISASRLTLRWGQSHAQTYRVEVSSDASTPTRWSAVHSVTQGIGGVEEIPLEAKDFRHLRVLGEAPADRGLLITQLELWAPGKTVVAPAPKQVMDKRGALLKDGWSLQSAMFAKSAAEDISSAKYSGSDWLPAIVPGTVLSSYLVHGAVPDPNYGNQQQEISEAFFTDNDFWYRNRFDIAADCQGRRLWLVFEGINWKADVYLNGKKLGSIEGAFLRSRFDITDIAVCGGSNCVAVLIHKVANPGAIEHKRLGGHYKNGGVLGLDSPTFLASIGWNWLPTIRGRNIGIWNDVRIETTGDVMLQDPWVSTELPGPDHSRADLTVRTEVTNASGQSRRCVLSLSMDKIAYRKEIALQPNETQSVMIDTSACADLVIDNPRLWWPNGYGEPVLHTMQLRLEIDGVASSKKSVTFGICQKSYRTDNGILTLFINGVKILCRGGNWGMDDGMLMCNDDGYNLRVGMHRDMNLNMIRNWIGMVGKNEFYDACDRHGILVWDDFWLANPGDGPDPTDHAMFMSNVVDKIRRVRSHPSLALYCGRNEGDPPPDLDQGMRDQVAKLDGTRMYIPASDRGLVTGHGPYDNQDPAWYFENRGATFHSEQGIVCVPPVESMRAMMPGQDLWPISNMWAVHDYQEPRSPLYTQRIEHRYGASTGIEDYCRKAQMVNLESAKAIYECLQSRQGSGLLIWMTQAAWPALICQLYDYSFEQTSAYFGAKTACEPIHILWDQYTDVIKVANNTPVTQSNLEAEASTYDLDGHQLWHKTVEITLPAASAHECFPLTKPASPGHVYFVKLRLRRENTLVSENFYWSPDQANVYLDLNRLPSVSVTVRTHLASSRTEHTATVAIANPTASVAVAIRLKIVGTPSDQRVLPAMYEDNYFSLLPDESRTVTVRFATSALRGEQPHLVVSGWNINEERHAL